MKGFIITWENNNNNLNFEIMKKFLVSVLAFSGFLFPLLAQVDHDYRISDIIPVEALTLKKEQIPPSIIKAVSTDFSSGQALTWGKFPYNLENYGWVVNKDAATEKPDHYEVYIKAKDGSDVYAVYAPDGTIIQSRSLYKNISLPAVVKDRLSKSQYKDWTVIGDREIIRYFNEKKNEEAHFRVTVEKNNVRRSISFNYTQPVVKEKE
jgi:hypothetical protein